jgi:hypothetical protein
MRQSLLPSIVALLAAICLQACGSHASTAKSASPAVRACDELAGHPEDPGRTGAGVADDDLLPEAAIDACLKATAEEPDTGRLHFQLGRAYWEDEENEDAVSAFLKAEELGYTPAYFYLGLAFEQGLIPEEPEDAEAALDMFLLAGADGFPPAVRVYEDGER